MTFLTVGALAIAILILVPTIAHLLQRGRQDAIGFPLVRLVLPTPKFSSRRGRLRDRFLFVLRGTLILTLALLGAIPLVRCDHPVLTRQQGASVALAIVLDDSGSMRSKMPNGVVKFDHAKRRAVQVISQLHEGDMVALILAGHPARLVSGATSQLLLVRDLCNKTPASDRSTDLADAIELADGSLRNLPQADRRIVLFSDLAQAIPKSNVPQWIPNPELADPVSDCGIISAIQQGTQVVVEVACSDDSGKSGRNLFLNQRMKAATKRSDFQPVSKPIAGTKNSQSITFESVTSDAPLEARLDGKDANVHNDSAPVFVGTVGTVVATLADYTTARAATGGPPLVEQALTAFGGDLVLRPWTFLPDDDRAYNDVSLLVLDDPPAYGPEVRAALQKWILRGGIVFAWLGPRAVGEGLGTSLSPIIEGAARWESSPVDGFDASSLTWLGPAGATFSELHAKGRLVLDEALPSASVVRAKWADSRASLVERQMGRGIVWGAGLPVSTDISDIGLRPGFLALFEHIINATRQRGMSPIAAVGHAWKFDHDEKVLVDDPLGTSQSLNAPQDSTAIEKSYVPPLAGIYRIRRNERPELRLAHIEAQEITDRPVRARAIASRSVSAGRSSLDLSPYLALALAIIALIELVVSSTSKRRTTVQPRIWERWLSSRAGGGGLSRRYKGSN